MKQLLEKYLGEQALNIICLDSVDSTNTALRALAEAGAAEGTVVIADKQTAGRGRRGRRFYSPDGVGLYMSILLRPALSPEKSLYLSSAAAVAAAETAEALSGRRAEIKWVNDVYAGGRKICGILTEGRIEGSALCYAIVGIGVNLLPPDGGFPEELRETAAALFQSGDARELRAMTAAGILERFMSYYSVLEQRPFLAQYRSRSMLTGRSVNIFKSLDAAPEKAFALGIGDDFSLLVSYPDGRQEAISSGEVTVRRIEEE